VLGACITVAHSILPLELYHRININDLSLRWDHYFAESSPKPSPIIFVSGDASLAAIKLLSKRKGADSVAAAYDSTRTLAFNVQTTSGYMHIGK
jgi:hypothetical protein